MASKSSENGSRSENFDVLVIGAGFGGMRMLWELRKLGLSAKVLEAGSDVGGTWYWNRYPGARTDSDAAVYCFWFDENLYQEWDWQERFPTQGEMEQYFRYVADRHDMRKDIQFNTLVESAVYDEDKNVWTVTTDANETFTSTYLVCATGLLHVSKDPPFPGLTSFQGEWYKTSNWPKEQVDFEGKRVAVIGTGATGVQVIPVVACLADQVLVFQRTPNYVVPGRNLTLDQWDNREMKRNYDSNWRKAQDHLYAFAMDRSGRSFSDFTPEEQHQIFDSGWEAGGFSFLFQTFDDLLVNVEANAAASEFVRSKIRAIVKDPETAELLCPKNHPYGGKRPPMGQLYYETFNRDNVKLIDVSKNAIVDVTEKGILLQNGDEFEVDVIIFALGFDALTGSLMRMNIRGRQGKKLEDKWRDAPHTHLGICIDGFPNLFMISGPQSPFANIPVVVEKSVTFIGKALVMARNNGDVVEALPEAVDAWGKKCSDMLEMSPIIKSGEGVNAWFSGANVEGKAHAAYFYYGGADQYFVDLEDELRKNFESFSA